MGEQFENKLPAPLHRSDAYIMMDDNMTDESDDFDIHLVTFNFNVTPYHGHSFVSSDFLENYKAHHKDGWLENIKIEKWTDIKE